MDSLVPVPTSEVGVWQLRRVGPPSTVQNSASLIRLQEDGEVTIGRGPAADYFLDSAVTLRLISRVHASIRGEKIAGGHPRFTIINSGLNGTYINDLKMRSYPDNQQVLHEGDRITFGHPGCASILPGAYAPQHDSEFQFIFECVPASRAGSAERYRSHARVTPLSGNPRHNHLQKQCVVISAGSASLRSNDSPQSNASTSEKENEVTNSVFRDVKNVPSSNGGYVRSPWKYQQGVHESSQLDTKQIRAAQCGDNASNVFCIDKARVNGLVMDSVSSLTAQQASSSAKLSICNTSTNLGCSKSSVNLNCSNTGVNLNSANTGLNLTISNLVKSSKAVSKEDDVNKVSLRNVPVPSTVEQTEVRSLSTPLHDAPHPVNFSKSLEKSNDGVKKEIEFHSTTIILSDELEEDESDNNDERVNESDKDGDDCSSSEVGFVSASKPKRLTCMNLKSEGEKSVQVIVENDDVDVVNVENEDFVNETRVINVVNHKNGELDVDNEIVDVVTVETDKNSVDVDIIQDENQDSDVMIDSDTSMPQLVLMQDTVNAGGNFMQDSEECMPPLMLMGDLPRINCNVLEHSSALTTKTTLSNNRKNGHVDIMHKKQTEKVCKNKQRRVDLSSPKKLLSSDRIDSVSSAGVSLPCLSKSYVRSHQESYTASETLPWKHELGSIQNKESEMSESVLVKSRPEPYVTTHLIQLRSESCDSEDSDTDLSESCDIKSHLEQPSTVIKHQPVLDDSCSNGHSLPSTHSVKTPITSGDSVKAEIISTKSVKTPITFANSVKTPVTYLDNKNHFVAVAHSPPCSEVSSTSRNTWEFVGSKLSSVKSPSSHLPTSSELLPYKATSPRSGVPTTNTTTIILSSGSKDRELSSKSSRKVSGKSSKHTNLSHRRSSESSSSSRPTSSSSNHSSSSEASAPNSRSSSGTSVPRPTSHISITSSRPSSGASDPNSRPSSCASNSNSRPSSGVSAPNSKPSSGRSDPNSRPSSGVSAPNSKPSSGKSDPNSRPSSVSCIPNSKPSSGTSNSQPCSTSSNPNSRPSSGTSDSNLRQSSGTSLPMLSSGASLPNKGLPPDSSLPNSRSSLEASLPKSKPSSGSSPRSRQSSESTSQNSRPPSESAPKKFFKDTVPNMYSSSDEESALQENKTTIVKKIYSSTKRKQENGAGTEVSRRSALFKMRKQSAANDTSHSLAVPSKPPAATQKHALPGCGSQKPPKPPASTHKPVCVSQEPSKTEVLGSSPASSPPTSDLSDIDGMNKKMSRTVSDTKLEKKTDSKASELPREVIRPKPSINKQPVPSSPSLSLTSLPWLAEVSSPDKSLKNISIKQTASGAAGRNVRPTALSSKNGSISSDRKDTSVTRSSSSVATSRTLSKPAAKTSQKLSASQATRLKSEKIDISKVKSTTGNVRDNLDKSLKSKTSSQTDVARSSVRGKDLSTSSGKTNVAGRANGLKRTHSNEKPVDSKNGKKRAASGHMSDISVKRDRAGSVDSDKPVSKKRDLKLSSQASSLSKSKMRQKSSSPLREKSEAHVEKTGAERGRRKNIKADSNSLPKGKSKKSSSSKKGKPSRAKKKRKKIMSDTSSDDDGDKDKQEDDDDEDEFDVQDMLDEDDDDSDDSESWELPDGVQYYDNLCSARKCLNPEGKQVDWVMCDKCEQWYHVVCVNCPNDVLDEDIPFHCGFC